MSRNAKQAEAALKRKVIPKSSQNRVLIADSVVKVHVTAPPPKGGGNQAETTAPSRARCACIQT